MRSWLFPSVFWLGRCGVASFGHAHTASAVLSESACASAKQHGAILIPAISDKMPMLLRNCMLSILLPAHCAWLPRRLCSGRSSGGGGSGMSRHAAWR